MPRCSEKTGSVGCTVTEILLYKCKTLAVLARKFNSKDGGQVLFDSFPVT